VWAWIEKAPDYAFDDERTPSVSSMNCLAVMAKAKRREGHVDGLKVRLTHTLRSCKTNLFIFALWVDLCHRGEPYMSSATYNFARALPEAGVTD
jgi:hypothetical protein